jgi:hypothetical protein
MGRSVKLRTVWLFRRLYAFSRSDLNVTPDWTGQEKNPQLLRVHPRLFAERTPFHRKQIRRTQSRKSSAPLTMLISTRMNKIGRSRRSSFGNRTASFCVVMMSSA